MSSTKKYPAWHESCKNRLRGVICGGKITSKGNYTFESHPDGGPDYSKRVRVWNCERCKKIWHQPAYRILMDPDNNRPDVSEYSQDAARGFG